jgi:hypothetical protein
VVQSRFGPRSLVTEAVAAHLLGLVQAQPNITIAELRNRIEVDKGVAVSWTVTNNTHPSGKLTLGGGAV